MKLSDGVAGKAFVVSGITGDDVALQVMRFGLDVGTSIYVAKNIAGGPVIVCKNQLEIAIGRDIAEAIDVTVED